MIKLITKRSFIVVPKRSNFFEIPATLISGQKISKLDELVGDKKAILVVNVASECETTDEQYNHLVSFDEDFRSQGLGILAYPCNQFGDKEPYSDEWI